MNRVAESNCVTRNLLLLALMLALSLLLVACGGGSSGGDNGGGGDDTTSPTVLGTSPSDGATSVGRSTIVVAVFSENLNAATVNNTSFTLTGGSGTVTGTISFDVPTLSARFVPDTTLEPLTTYTASLAGTITDVAGNALTAMSWSFTTDNKGWGSAVLIDNASVDSVTPRMAMDVAGNAMVVWEQDGYIWSNRYLAGSGWGTPAAVQNDSAVYALQPEVAVAPNGDAIAVWQQGEPNNEPKYHYHVLASYYTAATVSWGAPQYLGDTPVLDAVEDAYDPQVAIDSAGNALVVWTQTDNTHGDLDVWANRYQAGGSWSGAQLLEHDDVGDHSSPAIAMDPAGNAMAVWAYNDGHIVGIQASRYVQGTDSWTTPEDINARVGNAMVPEIAMDKNGNAIAVWIEGESSGYFSLWTNRYVPGSGWGTIELVEYNDGDVGGTGMWPQVAIDNTDGSAITVWAQDTKQGTPESRSEIWANRFE